MLHNAEEVLLICSVILFVSILAGKAGFRVGLPALLLFLGIGMLLEATVWVCSSAIRRLPSSSG